VSASARSKAQRVWVATELYWPEETSTAYFLTRIAEHLAGTWDVSVLCGQPKYDRAGQRAPSRETHAGVDIHRAAGTTLDKNVLPFRLVNMASITASLLFVALRHFRRGDIVLVTTNPPALPFVVGLAARLRGARAVLVLHDLYPDVLVAASLAKPDSLVVRLISAANRWLYSSMERICAVGRDMATLIRARVPSEVARRVMVIPNWGDLDVVKAESRDDNVLLRELGLADRFVVQYAGNAGPVHGMETILDAARALQISDPDVHFLFIGSGRKWPMVERAIASEGLKNITVLAPKPRSEQNVFLNACDVAVSAFVPGMKGVGVPSRTYNIMASGKPQVAAIDPESEQGLIIREENIGWVVGPGDATGLAAAIREAKANRSELRAMSSRARAAAESKYSREVVLGQFHALVQELAHA
jgi:colanic acid biosynthesis glycosyl transferase WcaI